MAPASINVLMKVHERFRERAHEIDGRESRGAPLFPRASACKEFKIALFRIAASIAATFFIRRVRKSLHSSTHR
ncbi:MAG: hypothetical protein ACYDA9_02750 [Terriglobia bacterium]